jgi:hypothetical protein
MATSKVSKSGKSYIRHLIAQRYPSCILKEQGMERADKADVVLCDALSTVLQMGPMKWIHGDIIVPNKSIDVIERLHGFLSHNHKRKAIVLLVDKPEFVPVQKGPTQQKRGKKSEAEQRKAEAQRRETRERLTLLDTNAYLDAYDRLCRENPDNGPGVEDSTNHHDVLKFVLNQSLQWDLPQPWQDALGNGSSVHSNGGRKALMRYVVRCLITDGVMPYIPSRDQEVYIDGHGFTMAELLLSADSFPMIGRQGAVPPGTLPGEMGRDELMDTPLKLTFPEDENDSAPDVDMADPWTKNTVGEGEMTALHFVRELHARKKYKSFVIRINDTDIISIALWYIWKQTVEGFSAKGAYDGPQIFVDISPPGRDDRADSSKRFVVDINQLAADIATEFEGDTICGMNSIPSFVCALAACVSDYTRGYFFITLDHFFEAIVEYGKTLIFPLIKFPRGYECAAVMSSDAYRQLVACAYYCRYRSAMQKAGYMIPQTLAKMRAVLNPIIMTKKNVRFLDIEKVKKDPSIYPQTQKEFGPLLSQCKRCIPDDQEIAYRGLLLAGFAVMMHQVGNSHLHLPNPLCYGYRLVDSNLPLSATNLAYCSSIDYQKHKKTWTAYMMQINANNKDLMPMVCGGESDNEGS